MSNPSEADVLPGANGGIQPGRYYGRSIPYLPINGYPGRQRLGVSIGINIPRNRLE